MTTLSKLASRTVIVPVWFLVFVLLVLSGSPMAPATGILLLVAVGVVLTVRLVLWTERPTIASMTPTPSPATLTSAGFVSNSWPDSGFRTSQQRGTRRD